MSTLSKVQVPTHSRTASLLAAILPAVALAILAWFIYHCASTIPAHHAPETKGGPTPSVRAVVDHSHKEGATPDTAYDPGDNDPDANRE